VELAARYVAAGEGNEVGGDFYDAFSLGGEDWALVMGDVCGKGAEAAAVTALARYTIRASVLHSSHPRDVLAELNEVLLRHGLEFRFASVLFATVRVHDGRAVVTMASGGHPLPLVLRADGSVEEAGRPGTLLGIVRTPNLDAATLELGPGDALVLYTDGVIEASPIDDAFGPERFAAFLAGLAGGDADELADRIERAVLGIQDGRPRDDVAVLVLRPAPFPAAVQGVPAAA
jgi:sigma-B regulation protein RsbU (phosphoserine phosphatase)